jgi:hypothetical protein
MNYIHLDTNHLLAKITGHPQALALMERYSTLTALARADDSELMQTPGVGKATAAAIKSALALASKLTKEVMTETPLLDTPEAVAQLLREQFRLQMVETFHVLLLNTRRRLLKCEKIRASWGPTLRGTWPTTAFRLRAMTRTKPGSKSYAGLRLGRDVAHQRAFWLAQPTYAFEGTATAERALRMQAVAP